jgi:hypothetical protein
MKKLVILAVLAMMVFAPQAYAEISMSANIETNTTFEADSNGTDEVLYDNGGRVETILESKMENEDGMFAAGKGCFELGIDGSVGMCDVKFELGNPSFTLIVGRYEDEGLFSKGEDVYIAGTGASQWYEANKVRGRDVDALGVKFAMGENMTFITRLGYDNDDDMNELGVRPVLMMNAGVLSLKVGGEYLLKTPFDTDADDEETWFGGAVDLGFQVSDTLKIGGTATYGKNEVTTVTVDDVTGVSTKTDTEETVMSDTFYVTIGMGDNTLGLAAGYTMEDEADTNELWTLVSYAMPLPVDGAKVKFGASFAQGDDGVDEPTAFGVRLRFNYDF